MRHLHKVVALLAILVLVAGIYRKSAELERSDLGFDLEVAAATGSPSPVVARSAALGASRAEDGPNVALSEEAWSQAIDTVLRDNSDIIEKSRRMRQMLAHLPPALQAEAAQHLVSFATDSTPEDIVEPLLKTNTHPSAQSVLLLGLLQRGDKIRLPALLRIARTPEHTRRIDALLYLQFLLESDGPADSAAWEARIEARLKRPSN